MTNEEYASDLANKLWDRLKYKTEVIDLDSVEDAIDDIFFNAQQREPVEIPQMEGTREGLDDLSIR